MQTTITSQPKDVVYTQTIHRRGAEAARGAHNSEVTGSKPVAGISNSCALEKYIVNASDYKQAHTNTFTGVAQGERAGLITPRSLVRTQSPVLSSWT